MSAYSANTDPLVCCSEVGLRGFKDLRAFKTSGHGKPGGGCAVNVDKLNNQRATTIEDAVTLRFQFPGKSSHSLLRAFTDTAEFGSVGCSAKGSFA